jgi:hypothetical protein
MPIGADSAELGQAQVKLTMTWLVWLDSNQRMEGSKSERLGYGMTTVIVLDLTTVAN